MLKNNLYIEQSIGNGLFAENKIVGIYNMCNLCQSTQMCARKKYCSRLVLQI